MSSSENEDVMKNGDLFAQQQQAEKKTAEKKGKSKSKKDGKKADDKSDKSKTAKEWTNDETSLLIELLEVNACLWDVFHKDYKKRDLKENAYSEIATALDTTVASIKTKVNSLRTQLGKELAKERNTKSGQGTDELYVSNWIFYQKLAFLIPVFGTSKSRDTMKRINFQEDDSEKEDISTPPTKKKTVAERKLDLLSRCTDAITRNAKKTTPEEEPQKAKISTFAIYVDEKLSLLNKHDRRMAEKRISDILFDIEMSADASPEINRPLPFGHFGYPVSSIQQQQSVPVTPQAIPRQAPSVMSQQVNYVELQTKQGQSYMDMMKQ